MFHLRQGEGINRSMPAVRAAFGSSTTRNMPYCLADSSILGEERLTESRVSRLCSMNTLDTWIARDWDLSHALAKAQQLIVPTEEPVVACQANFPTFEGELC